jgi:hypothetical protein
MTGLAIDTAEDSVGWIDGDDSGDDDAYDEYDRGIERHGGYREVAYDPHFDDVGGE